ncbi:MAG: RNA methyltransferase PUA domain-containing protein, partial [Thiotrichaceae bacterium]
MRIPRFYQAQTFHIGKTIDLSPENFRHAIQVMRLKPASTIILFNGELGEYQATLIEVGKRSAQAEIVSFDPVNRESPLTSKLVLALIKPD